MCHILRDLMTTRWDQRVNSILYGDKGVVDSGSFISRDCSGCGEVEDEDSIGG